MTWSLPGYTTVRELGRGATGAVTLARHEATGRPVAVKQLAEQLARDPGFLSDFRAEARLLTELDDPHIARLYEYVQSGDQAALVLELVDGVALRAVLDRHAPLSPEAALVVLKGSLLGLAAAHEHGVVHRDYKPDNVLVTAAGDTKLIDFGVAVRAGQEVPTAGTPAYMAPEQWAGASATPATDVYAATCVFTECLTGRAPYEAQSAAALRLQHLNAPVPADALPQPVRSLVAAGMAKDPRKRPDTARTFLERLQACAEHGYGADWEERGRRDLGRLALLLAALFPLAPVAATGLSAIALTLLGHRRWVGAAALAAAAVVGAGAAAATTGPASHANAEPPTVVTASALPTGVAGPTSAPATGSHPSATPARPVPRRHRGGTPSASAPVTGARPSVPSRRVRRSTAPPAHSSPVPTRPRPTPSTTASPPPPPSTPAPPPPAPAPTVMIKKVDLSPDGTDAHVTVTVSVSAPQPITVRLAYSDGTAEEFTESGDDFYAIDTIHHFGACTGSWTLTVTTSPAATAQPRTASATC